MKMTLVLCALVALTSCQSPTTNIKPLDGDSPIIVSDSSAHLKHKGPSQDFQVSNNGSALVAKVADGYKVSTLECWKGFSGCPSGSLTAGWTLMGYDGHSGSGNLIFTMTSADNMTIGTTFVAGVTDLDSKIDMSGDTNKGTDLIESALTLVSAVLNNNGSTTTLDCPSTPCKLRIHYK
jgi:hypothetical protein